jgi:hypothetical protein
MQKTKNGAAGSVAEMVLPFAATCRAEPAPGAAGYSRCLVDASIPCGYRNNPFGLRPFCLHPRHKEIVARTIGK